MRSIVILKWISGLLLSLVVGLSLVIAGVMFTETGTHAAWGVLTRLVPELSAGQVEGHLGEGLAVKNLVYQTDSIIVELAHADLSWQLNGPLFNELLVSNFKLSGVSVTRMSASKGVEPPQSFMLPNGLPLPISLVFDDIEVTDFQFFSEEQSSPLEITSASLRARVSADEVTVQLIDASSPLFTLAGTAKTLPSRGYQTESDFSWSLSIPGASVARGSLTIGGNQEGLGYSMAAQVQDERYGDLSLEGAGSLGSTELAVHRMEIVHAQSPATIVLDGRLAFAERYPNGSFNIHWTELQWPLIRPAEEANETTKPALSKTWVRSQAGQMTLSGSLNHYSARISASISTPGALTGNIELAATGDATSIDISTVDIRALKGVASGAVILSWGEKLIGEFQLEGKHFDPGEIFPQWRGDISFSVNGKQHGQAIKLDRLNANGLLRGKAFNLDAALSHDGSGTTVPRFVLTAGDSRLNLKGDFGQKLDLQWSLQSPDLSQLLPDATGQIHSSGTASGALSWPTIEAKLSATNFKMGSYRVGSAQLSASIDPLSQSASSVVLEAQALVLSSIAIDAVKLTASGTRSSHTAALTIHSELASLVMDVAGGWSGERWQGALNSGEFKPKRLASWTLTQPQKLFFSADNQTVKLGCWLSQGARLCLDGERKNERITSAIELHHLPFDYLEPLLASTVEVQGSVGGSVNFNSIGSGRWSTDGSFSTSTSTISLTDTDGLSSKNVTKIEPGTLSFRGDDKVFSTDFSFPITDGGGVRGDLTATHNSQSIGATTLTGDIALHVPDIKFLGVFSQELQPLDGELKLDLNLHGTLEALQPKGTIALSDARVNLTTPGLVLTKINLVATGDGNGGIDYRGQALSGGGSLKIDGRSALVGRSPRSDLRITGSDFLVWSTVDARVTTSPDLNVSITEALIDVTGDIDIPMAHITPQELPSGAISVSPDQVIVTPDVDIELDIIETALRDIRVQVDLILGHKVEVEGFGFKGRMEGQLAVKQEPDNPMVASGELKILEGEYRAYGQGLIIDKGLFLFAGGAIDNPGFSIRALRRPVPDIVVGVYANGELRNPQVSLFSEPAMSQSEQLSWLVMGRSTENSSGAENDYITQVALFLGMKGGNILAKNIGQNIGLDTIGFEAGSGEAGTSNDVNQAALVLGKYLTPKLYISYGLGLLDSLSTVKLRYLMTERWNLITESSAIASGGDISYSFEK
ncbi:MAG: translocation and assembly module TamB [Halioglobus sp.]|jgi:translocation and assembly module TamB